MADSDRPLMEFPTSFPLKAIGRDEDDFEAFVTGLVRKHVAEVRQDDVVTRPSGGGNYVAVTVTFIAESREQLDAVYAELSQHKRVLVLL